MQHFAVRHVRGAALVVALALVFTFLGVYGTDNLPFLQAFSMWVLTLGVGALSSTVISPWVFKRSPGMDWPLAVQVVVAALIIALPVTVALILMDASDGYAMPLRMWPIQFAYVYVISQLVTIGSYLLEQQTKDCADDPAGGQAQTTARDPAYTFMSRLAPRYRSAQLYAVSSEDHYIRAHTSAGEDLILMRLADAIDLLSGAEGVQVHRSWWVARSGVADARRDRGKPILILKSGAEAPVSRTYQSAVREAGLL
ncbi:MAG: LytTR family transcriptional regulator DNA-binding domain-containing protein [Pseudomonadota bacterium]